MAGLHVAGKLMESHLVEDEGGRGALPRPGEELALRVDQTLTQDATGTLVMLELEAIGLERVQTELSVQYVDHNLTQADHKNADDHLFLRSACRRFGVWFSPPGNGVSHPLHQERFGRPGALLLGADSHTCAAGALGMLAIGAGGIDVALAMAGEPFHLRMPEVLGVRLEGRLQAGVSAKDVALEMLRRYGVEGGLGRIFEYHGPGLEGVSADDRHVIANMGAELGATATVFPSDEVTRRYLEACGRGDDWVELVADEEARYDAEDTLALDAIEPLIALPTSPGNVVPVAEVEGRPIYQAYLGSSANPGLRDFAAAAELVRGRRVHPGVSFDVNPTTRWVLGALVRSGHLEALLAAGARLHQAGCNGCIGMGQAPASGRISLRTVPRNFPGRSGTRGDQVHLCSPETAAASALRGEITDPRRLEADLSGLGELGALPGRGRGAEGPWTEGFEPPPPPDEALAVELVKGPNVRSIPPAPEPSEEPLELPVLLVAGDDVSTDEILPAGQRALPFRSNIERIAEFAFEGVDPDYVQRAREAGPHAVVAGRNYGQGSSREHAALAPRTLGLRAVVALGFARIHRSNLINHGVVPLTFADPEDLGRVERGQRLTLPGRDELLGGASALALGLEDGGSLDVRLDLSEREREVLLAGDVLRWARGRAAARVSGP